MMCVKGVYGHITHHRCENLCWPDRTSKDQGQVEMVLKVTKRGVRSGNSLKRINNTAYQRKYRKEALIIRELIQTDENINRENFLGDVDLGANDIPYSMNKKGRWELPRFIKYKLEDGDYDDEKYAIQVVERHKLLRLSNCISVHTSQTTKGSKNERKKTSRNKGYLNADSILNPRHNNLTQREGARRLRRGLSVENDIEVEAEPEVTPSSVRYEVFYPPSSTSGLNYSKYAGDDFSRRDDRDFGACSCKTWCSCYSKKDCTRRNKFRDFIKEEMAYQDNHEIDEDITLFDDPFLFHTGNHERSSVVSLIGFLKTISDCKTPKKRRRRKSINTTSDTEKDRMRNRKVIYENVGPQEKSQEKTLSYEVETPDKMHYSNAVAISILNQETLPQNLKDRYGSLYVEGACFPRKFIIDISERIRDNLPIKKVKAKYKLHACVIFTSDKGSDHNTNERSIYKVMFNSTLDKHLGGHSIETLYDYMEITVEECLQRTVFYIETLSEFADEIAVAPVPVWMPNKTRTSSVAKCAEWNSETYIPNDDLYYTTFLNLRNQNSIDLNSDDSTCYETGEISSHADKLCDICYDSLCDQTYGTALQSCGHWFCVGCWGEYLENRIDSASTKLICPEFNCEKEVDPGTAVSLLTLKDVIRHSKCCHDNKVECDEITKWCPNTKCGRVHKANKNSVKVVTCNCGQTFCFDCLGEPHWPAPCDEFYDYFKKLKDTGDIGLAPVESLDQVVVNGKTCPHCKRFLEKNGGCPFMVCVCGGLFCWGCGRDWSSYYHDTKCFTHGYKNDHDTTEVTVEDDKRKWNKKQKWYNMAVRQRSEQHPLKIDQMKASKVKIAKHLSAFMGKSAKRGISISLDFEGKRSKYSHEQEKLPEYVNELIILHQELSRVAESTAVIIDSNKLPKKSELRLQYIIYRLSAFAEEISKGLLHGLERNPEELLATFKKARIYSMRTLKCLHKSIDKLEL